MKDALNEFMKIFFYTIISTFLLNSNAFCIEHKLKLVFTDESKVEQISGETRGFLSVPLDHEDSQSPEIRLFYRVLNPEINEGPTVIFLNGGPGAPASGYVTLDGKNNAIKDITEKFRTIVFDQRGTGYSTALDTNEIDITQAEDIIKLLGARQHAEDVNQLIKKLVPKNKKFVFLAHSYGAQIAFHYLALSNARAPESLILASPAVPYVDPFEAFTLRRLTQYQLNLDILGKETEIQNLIMEVKSRIERNSYYDKFATPLLPQYLSALWTYLDRNDPSFQPWIKEKLKSFLTAELSTVDDYLKQRIYPTFNPLNYALSSTELFPGAGDAQLIKLSEKTLKQMEKTFLPWMLAETDVLLSDANQLRFYGGRAAKLFKRFDQLAPENKAVVNLSVLQKRLNKIHTLVITGDADTMIPIQMVREQNRLLNVPAENFIVVPGGSHTASLNDTKAVSAIQKWLRSGTRLMSSILIESKNSCAKSFK